MDEKRRTFLKTSLAAGIGLSAGVLNQSAAAGKSDVYVGKGKASKVITNIVKKMGGMKRFVKPGGRVLVKPNASFANPPEWATTTSPEAVRTIAELCLEAGARRVIFCDHTLRDPDVCKEKSGIGKALQGLKGAVFFVPKQQGLYVKKKEPKARQLLQVEVVKELDRADTLISLPVAKSHSATGVSLGIKGLMGLVWDRSAYHREMDLHQAIAEQLYYMKPDLTIIDAGRALLDNGPSGPGKVAELNTYAGSVDPVAADSYAVGLASWYGRTFEGKNVKYIQHAEKLGFGNADAGQIREVPV